jgi:hypothetical protein
VIPHDKLTILGTADQDRISRHTCPMCPRFGLLLLAACASASFTAGSNGQRSRVARAANSTAPASHLVLARAAPAPGPDTGSNRTAFRRLSHDALGAFGVYWIHTPKSGKFLYMSFWLSFCNLYPRHEHQFYMLAFGRRVGLRAGSSFGLAILQACDPATFAAMRSRPTDPKVKFLRLPL